MKIRLGLIGISPEWETRYAPAIRAVGDRLVVRCVVAPVAHQGETTARQFGAAAVDGFQALAQREDVDAILYLSAEGYGALPILAACDAGKAVYCAVPADLDPRDADRIRQRVEQSGIAFFADFPYRQMPATLRLKELIATRLGPPRLIFCHHRRQDMSPDLAAPAHRELIRVVDWCRWVVGQDPSSVMALSHSAPAGQEGEDYRLLSLDFSRDGATGTGTVAQISVGSYIPRQWHEAVAYRPPAAMQIACERGIAFVDPPASLSWFDSAGRHTEALESERPASEQLLLQFYRAVTSLVRTPCDLNDAYLAQHIVLRAEDSRREGKRQALGGS